MADRTNPYEQYRSQKEFARLQRRMHGADTRRDEAERRHEVIGDVVHVMRFWSPALIAVAFGWIGPFGGLDALLPAASVVTVYIVTKIITNILNKMAGWLWPRLYVWSENLLLQLGGVVLLICGALASWPGLIVSGLALALMPTMWRWWARRVMARTDFVRMRLAEAAASPTGIME